MKNTKEKKANSNIGFWERFAKIYTIVQEKGNKELYAKLTEEIKAIINEKQDVLELACGTGQFTFALAGNVHSWIATDFSPQMLKEAQKRELAEYHKNIDFAVQDATALTFGEKTFDIVLIANALHIMPNPEKALSEIKRVLKDDGILIAPTFIYAEKINRPKIWIMEKAGFQTFYKWDKEEYVRFIQSNGFCVLENKTIKGKMLPECFLTAKKKVCE